MASRTIFALSHRAPLCLPAIRGSCPPSKHRRQITIVLRLSYSSGRNSAKIWLNVNGSGEHAIDAARHRRCRERNQLIREGRALGLLVRPFGQHPREAKQIHRTTQHRGLPPSCRGKGLTHDDSSIRRTLAMRSICSESTKLQRLSGPRRSSRLSTGRFQIQIRLICCNGPKAGSIRQPMARLPISRLVPQILLMPERSLI